MNPSDMIEELMEEGSTDVIDEFKMENKNSKLNKFDVFTKQVPKMESLNYKTDPLGLQHIRLLAHIYFKTPFFPDEWRYFKQDSNSSQKS